MRYHQRLSAVIAAALWVFPAAASATTISDVVQQVSQAQYTSFLDTQLYTHYGDYRNLNGVQHDLARANIEHEFSSVLKLTTSLEPFTYSGKTYYNVVATLPGTVHPSQVYIVGAHYDSSNGYDPGTGPGETPGAPGADDNASGVAAVLEAARVLSQYQFESTLTFIAFDREEQGMIGSSAYVDGHAADHIHGMISLDMIAYNPAGPHHDKAYIYGRTTSNPIKTDLAAAISLYGGGLVSEIGGDVPSSDHAPFEESGRQACLLIEHAVWDNPNYHTWYDSVDTANYLDYAYATDMTRGAVGYLATSGGLVPEPGSAVLLAVGVLALLACSRVRRGRSTTSVSNAPPSLPPSDADKL